MSLENVDLNAYPEYLNLNWKRISRGYPSIPFGIEPYSFQVYAWNGRAVRKLNFMYSDFIPHRHIPIFFNPRSLMIFRNVLEWAYIPE